MKTPSVRYVGETQTPVLVIDAITGAAEAVRDIAAALGPFPRVQGNSYPGLRRPIKVGDEAAAGYARKLLFTAAPAINAAFGTNGFDLIEASFSLVTAPPALLAPLQRVPHFDSFDPHYLAVMHYVSGTERSGTSLYRQRSTGIERVTQANVPRFLDAARREGLEAEGYIGGSTDRFEEIGAVEGVADRLVVYPGSMLHSGMIPADMAFSDDPRDGRLTANFFVIGRPR